MEWNWPPTRSEDMVALQSQLSLVKIELKDTPKNLVLSFVSVFAMRVKHTPWYLFLVV
jgi:hypothetical protein